MVDTYEVNRYLIDGNGQVIRSIKENETVKVETPKTKINEEYIKYKKMADNRDELSNIIMNECGSFYFNFFNNGLSELDVKDSVKVRFLYLCTYANYSDKGMYLVYDNGRKMNKKGISSVLKLSVNEFSRTYNDMISSGLVIEEQDGIIVNGKYVYRGKLKSSLDKEKHTRIFDSGLRELYDNCTSRQHKQLYYLFKLLPYVSFRFNAICKNPSEQNKEDVIPMKLSDISEIIGYAQNNLKKLEKELLKLKVFDQYAFLGIINANGVWYKINPRVLYSGTGECLKEFLDLVATDFSIGSSK